MSNFHFCHISTICFKIAENEIKKREVWEFVPPAPTNEFLNIKNWAASQLLC